MSCCVDPAIFGKLQAVVFAVRWSHSKSVDPSPPEGASESTRGNSVGIMHAHARPANGQLVPLSVPTLC